MKPKIRTITHLLIPGIAAALLLSGCSTDIGSMRGKYTYKTDLGNISTFSPTDYKNSSEGQILTYTSSNLWELVMNKEHTDHEIVNVMAADKPEDVTAEYAGNEKYCVPADAEAGYAWRITIRDDMKWENGDPITTADYAYSLKQYISPDMKNYRASSYYNGTYALVNAYEYYNGENVNFDDVGFVVDGDYTMTVILATPIMSVNKIMLDLPSITLVNPELYESCKKESGGLIKSSYGTSKESYLSCGPYKIESYQEGKEIHLTRNENWFGYISGYFADKYMTTDIVMTVMPDKNTKLSSFLSGGISTVSVNIDNLDEYGTSDYVYFIPGYSTTELALNIDFDSLKSREKKGENKTILSYKDFRKAFSFSIDRQEYISDCIGMGTPAYGLLSSGYICDMDTGEPYRNLPEAQALLQDVYEDYDNDLSGYNLRRASELLTSAYQQCYTDGNISSADIVTLEMHVKSITADSQKEIEFLETSLLDAAAGTPLENRIKLNLVSNPDYYNTLKKGGCDMIKGGWTGGMTDPYSFMEVYVDHNYILEYGVDTDAPLEMTVDGEKRVLSYSEWYDELTSGDYANADDRVRNEILCQLEKALLMDYHAIPLMNPYSAQLISQRLRFESDHYVDSLVGYGSFAGITYTMDDAEWAIYCQEHRLNMGY